MMDRYHRGTGFDQLRPEDRVWVNRTVRAVLTAMEGLPKTSSCGTGTCVVTVVNLVAGDRPFVLRKIVELRVRDRLAGRLTDEELREVCGP